MLTFTRGRLVPRQPRAIKRTTRTELRRCDIRNGKYIYCNNGAIPTALHHERIHIAKYIHWNIGITHTALHHEGMYIVKYIHCNNGAIPTALHHERISIAKYIHRNNGTTTAASVINIHFFVCINELIVIRFQ